MNRPEGLPRTRDPAHAIARQSYARCLGNSEFLARFYERLLASDPVIPPMFVDTEFSRQHRLLQHGLGLLLSYAKTPDASLLERIATRHSSHGLDVPPHLYARFVESLLQAAEEVDPDFDEATEKAWRETLAPGIEFMKSRYER